MKIVINGAGVGGPTLAWWLLEAGHEVTLVERAAAVRRGGYVIDFWGLGFDVADRMGLVPELMQAGYQVREVRFVDEHGRQNGGFSTHVFEHMTDGRFTSIRRSDLAAAIYDRIAERVDARFDDTVAALGDRGDQVQVVLESGAELEADLLVGADGLHSRVRELAFGPAEEFEIDLDYQVAAFEIGGYQPRDELVYVSHALPGRQISRFALRDDRTLFLFVFQNRYMPGSFPANDEDRRRVLRAVFQDAGWESGKILEALDGAADIYYDRVSQIRMDHWTRGRVALLGDAAACVSLLAGEGTGLAMTEAYVLAGELGRAHGDLPIALAAYEKRMQPFLHRKQVAAQKFASSFAPQTALGLGFRNLVTHLLRVPALADLFIGSSLHDDIELPEYGS